VAFVGNLSTNQLVKDFFAFTYGKGEGEQAPKMAPLPS